MGQPTPDSVFLDLGVTGLELPAPIRQYQWEGVNFLLSSDAALMADEMGLGKTVQAAIALDLLLRQPLCDRALVVTPASLRLNWERELARWAPQLTVRRIQGSFNDRAAAFRLPIPVLIASYEQVRTHAEGLADGTHFDVVILDEAQRIKNRDSDTALACRLLPRSRSWALTGTPVENSREDLVSLFNFVSPGLLHNRMPRSELHERMQQHFLRRKKEDVLRDLPPIIVQDLPLELLNEQRAAYEMVWESRKAFARQGGVPVSEGQLLALITKLKQLCNFHPQSGESVKADSLELILDGLNETADKVVIFSQYVETLKWLSDRLVGFPHELYHGQLPERERDQVLARFRAQPGPRALLISLQAGGVGLNLQEASAVLLFDRWWNPAVENQAIQRAHRFGRQRPLHVFRFLITSTIEERIAAVLEEKRVTFEQYVELAESALVRLFSRSELRRLLDLTAQDVDTGLETP